MLWNRPSAELSVEHEGQEISAEQILGIVQKTGSQASLGEGKGRYLPLPQFPANADVRWVVNKGQRAELEPEIVAGKYTVFDFYAEWCGPCRVLDQHLIETMKSRPDIALRKINIVDWDSPVSAQHLSTAKGLPYLLVYGPHGKQVDTVSGLEIPR